MRRTDGNVGMSERATGRRRGRRCGEDEQGSEDRHGEPLCELCDRERIGQRAARWRHSENSQVDDQRS
jgi:hypothetical protein